jgi:transcription elongation factor Elf1
MRVVRYENLRGWRPIPMTMPLEKQLACPACNLPLLVIAEMKGNQRVGVGGCDCCGYMGYLDRPTEEWTENFYEQQWDVAGRQRKDQRVAYFKQTQEQSLGHWWLVDMIRRTKPDLARPILEIGCGFGDTLGSTKQLGFKDTVGVENSRHRAEVAKEAFGADVRLGRFEDVDLKDKAPYQRDLQCSCFGACT